MGDVLSIQLGARKSRATFRLDFIECQLTAKQRRLQGRTVLRPTLDLDEYTCRAVIDWIDLVFKTGKPTQWMWIKKEIDGAIGGNCHIEGRRDEDTTEHSEFRVRFQEPDLKRLPLAKRAIEDRWSLQAAPTIEHLEVSIDFTPKKPSDLLLAQMFGVLVRTHLPGRDVISDPRDRPRSAWGQGSKNSAHVLPFSGKTLERGDELLSSVDNDLPAPFDSTHYVGARDARSAWRTMVKLVDSQNRAAGTHRDLPENEKRVRIEVTINSDDLSRLGVRTLDDLTTYRFQTLQGDFFQFRLPTFADTASLPADHLRVIAAEREKQRRTKFLNSGVVGLKAMDDSNSRIRTRKRPEMKRSLPDGKTLRPARRPGTGFYGTLVVYDGLTRRVLTALRHLGNRIKTSTASSSK